MAKIPALEEVLNAKLDDQKILSKTLVSRSGMHLAGNVPSSAHLETYVAMSAIILGAADTATSELNEKLSHVSVEMDGSRVVLLSLGAKALLVLHASKDMNIEKLKEMSQSIMEEELNKYL
jgi:predicted regulator of Ras-like GTPase activity (Roadblock/LC7/MglB family)